jgi:hypothetical protein
MQNNKAMASKEFADECINLFRDYSQGRITHSQFQENCRLLEFAARTIEKSPPQGEKKVSEEKTDIKQSYLPYKDD